MSSSVTVVVPVWGDYCRFLPECVESVLADEPRPKLIVVDNASEQPLPPLPQEVELVRASRRLSAGAARNLALLQIETPYVCFLDADDILLHGALGDAAARLDARHRLVSVISRYESWNPATGERRMLGRSPRPIALAVSRFRRVFALANLRYNAFPIVGGVHRTSIVRAVGGFGDTDVGEDWILGVLLTFRGRIAVRRAPAFLRRVHGGSLWYRPHTRKRLLHRCELLRSRVAADPAVPRWVKALLPLFAAAHRRNVRRLAPSGTARTSNPLLTRAES